MRDIQVSKKELIEILETNKANHRALYDEACTNYLAAGAKELEKKLEQVRRGRMVSLLINLPVPEDHTRDYERVIAMLNMEKREEILLPEGDYQQYVQDDWAWRRAWAANTMSYTAAGAAHADDDDDYYA
jgi:hypothetical protein